MHSPKSEWSLWDQFFYRIGGLPLVLLSCRVSSGPVCRAVEHVLRVADTLLVSLEVPGVVRRVLKIFNATVSRGVPCNIKAGTRIVLFKTSKMNFTNNRLTSLRILIKF